MDEIFEIIKAINRLKETVLELCSKIDLFLKSASQPQDSRYVEEEGACDILKICPRTLAKLRADKKILYIKNRHKILYLVEDLHEYLTSNIKR